MTQQTQTPAKQDNTPAKLSNKERTEQSVNKVMQYFKELEDTNELVLPKDYHYGNALKAAGIHLLELTDKNGKNVYDVCTMPSIVNALMEMVLDGLSVAKQQGYFIIYGNTLNWQPDYRGNVLKAKRDAGVKEVNANCIYEGDKFSYNVDINSGRMKLVEHVPSFENQDITKIKGAYAVVLFNDGTTSLEIMTLAQIKKAWMQGFGGGNTKAHQNFTDRMCRKTVINRAVNNLNGSSDDSASMVEDSEDINQPVKTRDDKVKEKGSKKTMDIQDASFEDITDPAPAEPADQVQPTPATVTEDGPGY